MPYIPQNERKILDDKIEALVTAIKEFTYGEDLRNADGRCNYAICELLMKVFDISDTPRYTKMNTLVGVLECVKLELYRRIIGDYEDVAILKSGDIPAFIEALETIATKKGELQR